MWLRQRAAEWTNEQRLYESALGVCPLNAKVYYNVAKIHADKGNVDIAIEMYKEAIRSVYFDSFYYWLNQIITIFLQQSDLIHWFLSFNTLHFWSRVIEIEAWFVVNNYSNVHLPQCLVITVLTKDWVLLRTVFTNHGVQWWTGLVFADSAYWLQCTGYIVNRLMLLWLMVKMIVFTYHNDYAYSVFWIQQNRCAQFHFSETFLNYFSSKKIIFRFFK